MCLRAVIKLPVCSETLSRYRLHAGFFLTSPHAVITPDHLLPHIQSQIFKMKKLNHGLFHLIKKIFLSNWSIFYSLACISIIKSHLRLKAVTFVFQVLEVYFNETQLYVYLEFYPILQGICRNLEVKFNGYLLRPFPYIIRPHWHFQF